MKTIHEILTDPESLLALSNDELKKLLAPYTQEVRKPVLPEEKTTKLGMEIQALRQAMKDPGIAKALAARK